MNDLEIWDHDGLETVTATEEGIDLDLVLTQPHLLFLGSPLFGGRISEASSALLLSQLIHRLYRRPSAPYGVHVFRVKEEVARLASRLPLEELLSVSRESGVSVILALQDVAQFEDENERLAILGNCSTYVGMPTGSIASGKYLMDRLGDRFQSSFAVTQSSNTAFSGGWSKSRNISTVPVLGGREIMEPAVGQRPAIVHSPQLVPKPILVDLYRPEWA
jgi:type IV secretory pathway TraG/TraD family ATPase VirD4